MKTTSLEEESSKAGKENNSSNLGDGSSADLIGLGLRESRITGIASWDNELRHGRSRVTDVVESTVNADETLLIIKNDIVASTSSTAVALASVLHTASVDFIATIARGSVEIGFFSRSSRGGSGGRSGHGSPGLSAEINTSSITRGDGKEFALVILKVHTDESGGVHEGVVDNSLHDRDTVASDLKDLRASATDDVISRAISVDLKLDSKSSSSEKS